MYILSEETLAAIMMLYKNMKVKVRSPDGDPDFNILAGVLLGDTLVPYLFIICLNYVFRMSIDLMKENGFHWQGKKQKIPCTNYYGYQLYQCHTASGKYTHPSQIPST